MDHKMGAKEILEGAVDGLLTKLFESILYTNTASSVARVVKDAKVLISNAVLEGNILVYTFLF